MSEGESSADGRDSGGFRKRGLPACEQPIDEICIIRERRFDRAGNTFFFVIVI